jgi:hypothetical protein
MVKGTTVANLIHKKTLWIMIFSPSMNVYNLGPNLTKKEGSMWCMASNQQRCIQSSI